MSRPFRTLLSAAAALAFVGAAQTAEAQRTVELRGGLNVPTFDITDAAKSGASFGLGLGMKTTERLWLLADLDFGMHDGAAGGPELNVNHYIAKLGYQLMAGEDRPVSVILNAGAGVMTFGVDGGDTFTYPAINVGAKIAYRLNDRAALLLSPQGDIAFTKKSEVGTDNAWVWPFSAGIRISF